jgi:hypothetical protein
MMKEDIEQLHTRIPSSVRAEIDKIVDEKYHGRYGGLSTEITIALLRHVSEYKKGRREEILQQHTHKPAPIKNTTRKLITPTEIEGRFRNWIVENVFEEDIQDGISQDILDRALMSMGANLGTQKKNRRALEVQGCILKNNRSGKYDLPKLKSRSEQAKPKSKVQITSEEQKQIDTILAPEIR